MLYKRLYKYKNKAVTLIALLGILIGITSQALASDSSKTNEKNLLLSLFPGSSLSRFKTVLGRDAESDVICNAKLRGKSGFIPMSNITAITLSSSLSAIAFPIYLHNTSLQQNKLIMAAPDTNSEKSKLIQVIFYNQSNGRLYGKPQGFPLSSNGWTCGGDFCDNLEISGFESIENSTRAVVFKYSQGVSSHRLYALAFNGSTVISSRSLDYGNLGGDSGILMSLEYTKWLETDGAITALVNSECDNNQIEYCRSAGMTPGSTLKRVHILNVR